MLLLDLEVMGCTPLSVTHAQMVATDILQKRARGGSKRGAWPIEKPAELSVVPLSNLECLLSAWRLLANACIPSL